MKKKAIVFLICSAIFIVFFPIIRKNYMEKNVIIEIETLASKNDQSQGTEIWIDGIMEDGRSKNFQDIELSEGWENRGRIYSLGDKQYTLAIPVKYIGKIKIKFLQHPFSGKIQISKGDMVEIIDLYSPEEKIEEYIIR